MKEEEEEWKSRGAKGSCILLLYPSLLSFLVPLLESASRISGRPVGRALRPFNPNGRLYRPSGLHRPRVFMTRTEDRHRKHIPCAFSNHLKKKYLVKFIDFAKKRKFAWKNEIQFHLARAHTHIKRWYLLNLLGMLERRWARAAFIHARAHFIEMLDRSSAFNRTGRECMLITRWMEETRRHIPLVCLYVSRETPYRAVLLCRSQICWWPSLIQPVSTGCNGAKRKKKKENLLLWARFSFSVSPLMLYEHLTFKNLETGDFQVKQFSRLGRWQTICCAAARIVRSFQRRKKERKEKKMSSRLSAFFTSVIYNTQRPHICR